MSLSVIDISRRLLSITEVADRLGVSRRTVQRKITSGEIPAFQLGGKHSPIRVDECELEAWLYRDREVRTTYGHVSWLVPGRGYAQRGDASASRASPK